MKSIKPEKNHPAITTHVFARPGGSGLWKERAFFGFAAIFVLYLVMFVAAYQWSLHAPHQPNDDPPGLPIAETIL